MVQPLNPETVSPVVPLASSGSGDQSLGLLASSPTCRPSSDQGTDQTRQAPSKRRNRGFAEVGRAVAERRAQAGDGQRGHEQVHGYTG